MAGVAAAEAPPAVLLRVHKQEFIGPVQVHWITKTNEVRQDDPLGQLNGEVLHPVTCTRKGPITPPGGPKNSAIRGKMGSQDLRRDPPRAARYPDLEDGFLNGPPMHQLASSSSPRNASLQSLQSRQVGRLREKL
jgi:hypothetical protein